jgi:hypothetical protein
MQRKEKFPAIVASQSPGTQCGNAHFLWKFIMDASPRVKTKNAAAEAAAS